VPIAQRLSFLISFTQYLFDMSAMSITFFGSIDLTSLQTCPSYDANCKVLNGLNTVSFTRIRSIFC